MHAIAPTIKPDDSGDQVANLQAALLFLLDSDVNLFFDPQKTPTPDELKGIREALLVEASIKLFDKTTRALTLAFQQRQGLSPRDPGVVDQITADALNDRFRQLGALDGDRTLAVKGYVLRAGIAEPQPGVQVRAFAFDATGETDLGASQTNNDGIYRVEFLASLVQAVPDGTATDKTIVVRAYRADGSVMGSAQWAGGVEAVMVLDVVVELDEFVVRGRVTDTQGRPQGGLKVVAFDRDLRRHQRLNDASTDLEGAYSISYRLESFRRADGKTALAADVFVAVLPDDGLDPLAMSETRYQAKPVEIIDVVVPALEKEAAEFERVTAQVMPLLEGQGKLREVHHAGADPIPTDLQPHEVNAEDIEFIVRETGLDASLIQAWAAAARMARELALAAAQPPVTPGPEGLSHDQLRLFGWNVFYGFIRNAQARDLDAVLLHNANTWAEWQRWNAEGGWVDGERERRWFGIVQTLERLRKLRQVDPVRNPEHPLARVLTAIAVELPPDLIAGAADVFAARGIGEPEALFPLAPDGIDGASKEAAAVRRLVRGVRLHNLTGGDTSLMRVLGDALASGGADGHGLEPLAKASRKQWAKWCTSRAEPEAADIHAALPWQLQARVERAHPDVALAARLEERSLPLPAQDVELLHAAANAEPKAVAAMLAGQAGDSAAAVPAGARDLVQNLGRYLKLGFTLEAGSSLWAAGIKSPGAMTSLGFDVIQGVFGDTAPVAYVASVVQQAQAIVAGSAALFNAVAGSQMKPFGLHKKNQQVSAEVSENLPTLRGLFGDLDECLCRPCESVLGLPAYLADLLTFLKKIPAHTRTAGTALEALRSRRPDITGALPLGCEQAEKEVQHIDLVIEVLQGVVGANPETTLAGAAYTWTLPYARPEAEMLAWLDHAGADRTEWMAQLLGRAGDPNHHMALAAQRLGLSRAAWVRVATPAVNDDVWPAYGFANAVNLVDLIDPASGKPVRGTPLELLSRVSVLLNRSGLELEHLIHALQTRFVSSGTTGTLNISGLEGCKTSEMFVSGLSAPILDQLHRFVRLWRALPSVSMPVLDSALNACAHPGSTDFGAVLVRLSRLIALHRRLGVGLDVLLALFKPLHEVLLPAPDLRLQSLYASVFRAQQLAAAQRDQFPDDPTAASAFSAGTLSATIPAIALAMRCSPQALTRWVLAGSTAATTTRPAYLVPDTWDYATLTALYRRHTLADALSLSPSELALLCAMTGAWPLQTNTADAFNAAVKTLLEALAVHKRSSLTIEEAAHLLLPVGDRQGVPEPASLAPDWAGTKAALLALRVALRDAPQVTVGGDDAAILRAKGAAMETLAVWIAPDPLQALAIVLEKGAPTNPADLPTLRRALDVPVPGLHDADGEAITFLAPWQTADLLRLPTEQERLQFLHDRIREVQLQTRLREELARWSKLPEPVVDTLLARDLPVDTADVSLRIAGQALLSTQTGGLLDPQVSDTQAAGTTALADWMHRLQRWAWLMSKLNVTDIPALLDAMRLAVIGAPPAASPFSLLTLLASTNTRTGRAPWAPWRSLIAKALMLRDSTGSMPWAAKLLRDLGAAGNSPTASTWLPLAKAWAVSPEALHSLFTALLPTARESTDPWHWWHAHQLVQQSIKLKLELPQLLMLCDAAPTAKTAEVAKAMALSTRKTTSPKVEDQIKARWRDALLAHATTTQGKTVEELYAHYLIDMQMAPCMKTTRILQAIASVQQFVHRTFFGLEPGIGARLGADLEEVRRQWAWMSQYRVWEANHKVFLFPENWLLPELRDDKSDCFKGLEAALAQPDATNSDAEDAFARFLDDVAQTGRIHVLGMFEDIERGQPPNRSTERRDLYQVGRTPHPPYRYYWRVCRDFGLPTMEWAPWRLIDMDIQGDHVVPFVLSGDLYIAWPNFERESGANASNTVKLKMAWSRLVAQRWSRVEVTRDALTLTVPPVDDERTGFAFRAAAREGSVLVTAYARQTGDALRETVEAKFREDDPPSPLTNELKNSLIGHRNIVFIGTDKNGAMMTRGVAPRDLGVNDEDVGLALVVDAEVWVKVTAKNGKTGFVRLASGTHAKYVVDVLFTIGSQAFALLPARAALWANAYGTPPVSLPEIALNARLTIHGKGDLIPGGQLKIGATPPGVFRSVKVTLTIVPSSPTSPEELGLKSSETFDAVAALECTRSGDTRLRQLTPGQATLPLLPLCSAEVGGYRGGYDTRPLVLPVPDPASPSIEPFLQPYWLGEGYFYTTTDIWLVGAASNEPNAGNPSVWHYFDGHDGCLVDFLPYRGSSRRFELLAAANTDAASYRSELAGGVQKLARRGNDPIRFSADGLPRPAAAGDTPHWQAQLAGNRGFDLGMPYGAYSWEVFFHAPVLIADRLSKQGRYADAEQWLRMVLDPTSGEPGNDATRFLRFKPFRALGADKDARESLEALAKAKRGLPATGADAVAKLVQRWRRNAFMPFAIARGRPLAFLWRTVFAYLDNLLAWADDLFRMDTRESINEATQLYVLASQMLGQRPKLIRGARRRTPVTYDQVELWWDDFANAWVDTFTAGSGASVVSNVDYKVGRIARASDVPMSGALYFCLPVNPKIIQYWDRVEQRLFNIRHCRNIEGVQRELPLTEAPIDPELLVRAVAAGLDIGDVLRGLYAPPHAYRFQVLLSRALDLANEARSLAAGLLSAIEKRDAEQMSQLRSSNELALLERVRQVRVLQRNEAEEAINGLKVNRDSAERRFRHLQRLLGKNASPPERRQTLGDEPMISAPVARQGWGFSEGFGGKLGLIEPELAHIDHLGVAHGWMIAAGVSKGVASLLNIGAALAEKKDPSTANLLKALGASSSFIGDMSETVSKGHQNQSSKEQARAGHQRRRDEWAYQANQVLAELRQIDKQLTANEIRRDIAITELENQQAQIQESRQIDDFLRAKFSNAELYQWMHGELAALLKSTYRIALDMARRAEAAAARELGAAPLSVVRNDHWNQRRAGLLAPEQLVQDLKRLELAHLERNRREHEMIKHISLRMLDPQALIKLMTEGACDFKLPEWLFDMDVPGHYLRRLKSIGLSIPCVVGPYTSVNCRLTLMRSVVRVSATASPPYASQADDDPRFEVRYGATESVVTSTGRDDSGLFETNLRDDRYLPFEYAGAESTWHLELTSGSSQFDRATISDVVLHVRYTARDGGESLTKVARDGLKSLPVRDADLGGGPGHVAAVSCRTEFAAEWSRAQTDPTAMLDVRIEDQHLPYWMRAAGLRVSKVFRINVKRVDGALAADDPVEVQPVGGHYEMGKLATDTFDVIAVVIAA